METARTGWVVVTAVLTTYMYYSNILYIQHTAVPSAQCEFSQPKRLEVILFYLIIIVINLIDDVYFVLYDQYHYEPLGAHVRTDGPRTDTDNTDHSRLTTADCTVLHMHTVRTIENKGRGPIRTV